MISRILMIVAGLSLMASCSKRATIGSGADRGSGLSDVSVSFGNIPADLKALLTGYDFEVTPYDDECKSKHAKTAIKESRNDLNGQGILIQNKKLVIGCDYLFKIALRGKATEASGQQGDSIVVYANYKIDQQNDKIPQEGLIYKIQAKTESPVIKVYLTHAGNLAGYGRFGGVHESDELSDVSGTLDFGQSQVTGIYATQCIVDADQAHSRKRVMFLQPGDEVSMTEEVFLGTACDVKIGTENAKGTYALHVSESVRTIELTNVTSRTIQGDVGFDIEGYCGRSASDIAGKTANLLEVGDPACAESLPGLKKVDTMTFESKAGSTNLDKIKLSDGSVYFSKNPVLSND